jgi:methyl-accepting chemotaxis protein
MDEVTQQNAALVEEAAAAAESLEEQARGLVQAVSMFRLATGGTNLPAVALRDATPKRLAKPTGKSGKPVTRELPPAKLAQSEDEWEEF